MCIHTVLEGTPLICNLLFQIVYGTICGEDQMIQHLEREVFHLINVSVALPGKWNSPNCVLLGCSYM